MNLILGLIVILVIGAIIYVDNARRGYKFGDNFLKYLNQSYHWHDWGHFLLQFSLTMICATFMPMWAIVIPSVVLTFSIELFGDKHYKDFWKNHDMWFDVLTHLGGTLSAFFFLI